MPNDLRADGTFYLACLDTKEEAIYYNLEKRKASKKLLGEGVNELVTIMLRRAFAEGYKAKDRYEESLKEGEDKRK